MRDRCKGVDARLGNENHTATVATIATVWSTTRNVLFAAETHSATTAVASNNFDLGAVDKHGVCGASGNCRRSTNRTVNHVDTATLAVEQHDPVRQGEERVISPHPHILAGMELGTHLANENISRLHRLTTKPLDTPPLRVGVATIAA
jgi:hypothetical protein